MALTGVWVGNYKGGKDKMYDRKKKKVDTTYGNPGGNKVNLVEHIHKMFMCLFLSQVLDDGLTPRTQRISCIQNVDDDIG